MMKTQLRAFLIFLFALFATAGCGEIESLENVAKIARNPAEAFQPEPGVPGTYVDSSLEKYFRDGFNRVKSEFNFMEGEFWDLTVIIMPPTFPCKKNAFGICNVEFARPNVIKIGDPRLFVRGARFYLKDKAPQPYDDETPPPAPSPSGIFIDSTTEDWLLKSFAEVKLCGGFAQGSYEELAVKFMPPGFPCGTKKCDGRYNSPNYIKLGDPFSWKHEVVHYLLYLNTGDLDSGHKNSLFNSSCVF